MTGLKRAILGFLIAQVAALPAWAQSSYEEQRAALIEEIERDVRQTRIYTGKASLDESVIGAMATVERHEFVPLGVRDLSYVNRPLPIGEGQTISHGLTVAAPGENPDAAVVDPVNSIFQLAHGVGA